MRGYFAVDIRDEKSEGSVTDYRILFKSPGTSDPADLADCLQDGLRRTLFPDALILVCIPSEVDLLCEAFNSDAHVEQALTRASSKVCVAICEIDKLGKLGAPRYIKNPRKSLPLVETERQSVIFDEGLRKLFSAKNVLVAAPAGFIFVNPSERRSKFFIRAEEALHDTEHVHFLAYALLNRISNREKETQGRIEVIFIDTMAIASLAYVLRELYRDLFKGSPPRVESFHSYRGMKNVPIPRRGTSLCLISASSSMNMHRDWQEFTRCFPSEVVTLITFKNAKESELAVFAFDHNDSKSNHDESHVLKDLRIVGESFSPEGIPLKPVLLTVLAHRSERWFNVGKEYSKAQLFSLMKAERSTDKTRPFFVEGARLLEYQMFKEFVEREMMQRVPLSVSAIVHQDDISSKDLANSCAEYIKKIAKSPATPRVINATNLAELADPIEREGALLIVAAVIGRGTRLLSISRDLRDLHVGARHYLVGFQVSESIDDYSQLKKNLCFSATKSAICISIMESVAVGRTVGEAYKAEETLLNQWKSLSGSAHLVSRMNEMRNRSGVSQNAFLPATLKGAQNLMLRKDFAYWKDGYDLTHDHSMSVLITAASMLQYARESKDFKDDNHRLASDTFQQVVLDPENFARYNDGVIQAALLRAAHPSELDYSSHEEASRRMTDLLSGVFKLHEREQGEAALEFALALRSGRLKLSSSAMKQMRQETLVNLRGSGEYFSLLKNLLDIDSSDAWSDKTSF